MEHLVAADEEAEAEIDAPGGFGGQVRKANAALAEREQQGALLGLHEIGDLPMKQKDQNTSQ